MKIQVIPVVRPPNSLKAVETRSREQTKKKSKNRRVPILTTPNNATGSILASGSRSMIEQVLLLNSKHVLFCLRLYLELAKYAWARTLIRMRISFHVMPIAL